MVKVTDTATVTVTVTVRYERFVENRGLWISNLGASVRVRVRVRVGVRVGIRVRAAPPR